MLEQEAQAIKAPWGENGTSRLLAHTVIGGLTGGLGGAAGAAAGTLTAPEIAKALKDADITGPLAVTLTELASTAAGAIAGGATGDNGGATAGAAAALNEVANNWLNHQDSDRLKDLKAKKEKGDCDQQCQSDIKALERLNAEREVRYIAAYVKCRETKSCQDLQKVDAEMTKDMGWIGVLSKNYESKGDAGKTNLYLDPKTGEYVLRTIRATGQPDPGGSSFGSYQIAANTGSMDDFMNFLKKNDSESYNTLNAAGGVAAAKAGKKEFVEAWQSLASNGTDFAQLQEKFIDQQKFKSSHTYAVTLIPNLDSRSPIVQEIIKSGAVQHGTGNNEGRNGNNKVIKKAWTGQSNVSDEQLIVKYYTERKALHPTEASRYAKEMKMALEMLNKSKSK
jgi:filamentous hemagglutinin